MEVEILESAHNDMLEGYWFYERRQPGLGDYFTDALYGEMGSLRNVILTGFVRTC